MFSKHNYFARCRYHEGGHHWARLLAIHPASLGAGAGVGYAIGVAGRSAVGMMPIRVSVGVMAVGGSVGMVVTINLNMSKLFV